MSVYAAFARRDFLVSRSYRLPFVVDLGWGVIDLVLYYFISKIVGPIPAADLQGAPSYFAFALAGILVALMIESATSEISSELRSEQLTGTLELLCAQPIRAADLAIGYATFPFAYAGARVAVYLALSMALLDLGDAETDWVGVVVMLVVSALAFVGLGILAAAATVVWKQGDSIVAALMFAMVFISGALFPLEVLPDWLEPIGRAMPTSFAFEGMRDALFNGGGWETEAAILIGIAIVGIPLALKVFSSALAHARRKGTLAEY